MNMKPTTPDEHRVAARKYVDAFYAMPTLEGRIAVLTPLRQLIGIAASWYEAVALFDEWRTKQAKPAYQHGLGSIDETIDVGDIEI
jgi:hypothetical protein